MEYWKQIELSNIETIIAKTKEYIETKTTHLDKKTFRGPFNALDNHTFKNFMPELIASLREHGLFYEDANVYVMWNNQDALPHKDYTGAIGRLNIPILNCEGTYTTFYENLKTRRLMLPTGNPYYLTTNKDYVEASRVEMLKPAICRISEGHSVIMDEERRPRIMLTISTIPDAGLLLNN
jgi:hypothetical protein